MSYLKKKNNRNVKGMPQSQTAANLRLQEEEKKDKNIHAQNKQTNVREAQRQAPSSPSELIRLLKQTEKRGQRAREDFKTASSGVNHINTNLTVCGFFRHPRDCQPVGRNAFLSSPYLCFIIVFICDLFISRDDPLMS